MADRHRAARRLVEEHLAAPVGRDLTGDVILRARAVNPTCGDEVELRLVDTPAGPRVGWSGRGCALSLAAASVLCDVVAVGGDPERDPDVAALLAAVTVPSRRGCVLLVQRAWSELRLARCA